MFNISVGNRCLPTAILTTIREMALFKNQIPFYDFKVEANIEMLDGLPGSEWT